MCLGYFVGIFLKVCIRKRREYLDNSVLFSVLLNKDEINVINFNGCGCFMILFGGVNWLC